VTLLRQRWATVLSAPPAPPPGKGPEWGKAAPIGLLIILLLCAAFWMLMRSMNKHIRKVRALADAEAAQADAEAAQADVGIAQADAEAGQADAGTAQADAEAGQADAGTAQADAEAAQADALRTDSSAVTGQRGTHLDDPGRPDSHRADSDWADPQRADPPGRRTQRTET